MSRKTGLQKLSVEYLSVYRFKSGDGAEYRDYLVKLEIDESTKENYFVAYYGFLRGHYLFLFNHNNARSCKHAINLENCIVRDAQPDKRWPSCCSTGCQIWLAGSSGPADAAAAAKAGSSCWQLGFFASSKWRRCLEAHIRRGGSADSAAAIAAAEAAVAADADNDYDNEELDASDQELSELWTTLAELDPCQLSSAGGTSVGTARAVGSVAAAVAAFGPKATAIAAAASPPPPKPGPKPPKPNVTAPAGPPPPVRRTPVMTPMKPSLQPPQSSSLLDAPTPTLAPPLLPPPPQTTTSMEPPPPAQATAPLTPTPQAPPPPPLPPKDQQASAQQSKNPPTPALPPKTPLATVAAPAPPPPSPPPPPSGFAGGAATAVASAAASEAPPPVLPPKQLPPPSDLYELLTAGHSVDALCSYFCRGYYSHKGIDQAKQLMRSITDKGAYMLRGFCNSQAGQDKTLCIKYGKVYKFRIRVLTSGYQVWNDCNDQVHSSMEALLFYHHIFPIKIAQQLHYDFILRGPFDLEAKSGLSNLTNALSAALWNHGSKELCAEILKSSDDGTYTLRGDPSGVIVLCVTHRSQILKFRIIVTKTDTGREFAFHHQPNSAKFNSLEDFIVHHHKNPIRGSAAEGDIVLKVPFQLVQRCQQELDFQQLALDNIFSVDSVETAAHKVSRMKSGNFLFRRSAGTGGGGGQHVLIVRDDNGLVRQFHITEKDTDLSFRPQKIFMLDDKPELVTDRIEKMIHFLCTVPNYLSPDISLLVKP